MELLVYGMFAITIFVIVFAAIALVKWKGLPVGTNEVFEVSDGRIIIFTGLQATYNIDDIENVAFSIVRSRRSASYSGTMRVVKKNGKKSRPFIFCGDSKNIVLAGSKPEIEKKTLELMEKLRLHNIRVSR